MTIRVTSDAGEVDFEAHFESEVGFSISANSGVTPATFTVGAEHFTGTIRAKQDASISVTARRGDLTASRTGVGAIRVVRDGGDFTVSGIKAEDEE